MPLVMRASPILVDARSHEFPRSSKTPAAISLRNLSLLLIVFGMLGAAGCVGVVSKPGTPPVGVLDVSPNPVQFGNVMVGSSAKQTVAVTNAGVGNVTLTKIAMSGAGFTISGPSTPITFTPGQSENFTVTFKSTGTGLESGNISITIGDLAPQLVASATATGVAASMGVSPGSVSFGNVHVGTPATQTIQLTNGGSASGTINSISATGTGFSVSGLSTPQTLNPGQSVTFTAEFKPPSSGADSGSISIATSSSSSPMDVSLSGTGVTSTYILTPSATSLSFGSVNDGTKVTKQVVLQNTGSADVDISTVSVSGSGYSVSGVANGTDLTPGQSATLNVIFDPSTGGSLPGTVKIASNAAGSPLDISLSGTGVAAATYVLTPSPASLSFGSVNDGTTATQQVNLQNTGTGTVDISTVSITGSGYTFSGVPNGTNLTPGQTAVLTVNFDPSTTGSIPGTVTIKSNAAGSPLSIGLSGTGTSGSTSHSVALAWDPSSSSVVGYYVYRSSKPSGPFKKLNSTPNSDPGYTDTNVTDGLMYFYYVTAVNSENIESSDSNQISVTIPSD
jgi:hypothetical protein